MRAEYGAALKGRTGLFDREIRYKAVANWGTDFKTAEGFTEARFDSYMQAAKL